MDGDTGETEEIEFEKAEHDLVELVHLCLEDHIRDVLIRSCVGRAYSSSQGSLQRLGR